MTNFVSFLRSIFLLIVLLSYTDGQWNEERWDDERWNDEKWNDKRPNDERRNNERSTDERRNSERLNDERRNSERSNDEGRNSERSNDDRRNNERTNDERLNNNKRNNERPKDELLNNERSNEKRQDDKRSNNDRRNNERRNDEKRNNERSKDETWNNNIRNNERPNNERQNSERSNDQRRDNQKSNNKRRKDERREDDKYEDDRLLSFADKCPADKKEDWSYRGNNGVLMWSGSYPECGGRAQSPVAINSYEAIFDENIEKLKFHNYHTPVERATIKNDGHTIRMTSRDDVERAIHFDSTRRMYRLRELHFHWGDDKSHGSEHTIDFIHYALEMHLVHQSGTGRTVVVAVFFREQSQTSKELQNIIQSFPKLMYKDNSTELKSPINLNKLLPANPASYYWYEGSLTTPPCTEGVQWLLLPKIMPIGTKQMDEFRKLYSSSKADSNEHCKISNNYRPLQPLNGRTVFISL